MKSFLADIGDAIFRLIVFDSTDFESLAINLLIGMLEATVLKHTVELFFKFSRPAEDTSFATGMRVTELEDDSNLLGIMFIAYEFRIETTGLVCVALTTFGFKV